MDLSKSYEYFQPEKVKERIHIIGCGSVGGTIAENLVRLGLTNITLWDMDTVSAHNIANQIYRYKDIGAPKVTALADILCEINPDLKDTLKLQGEGWNGQKLNGYVFLCPDDIDVRRAIVEKHMDNIFIKCMFDVRTLLESAQHYACDWSDYESKKNFLKTMDFTNEESDAEAPLSACGVILGVAPTIRGICADVVANFVNYVNGKGLKKMVLHDIFKHDLLALA